MLDSQNEKNYGDVLDGADDISTDTSEIPAELEGIPEDIAREVLSQSVGTENPAEPAENVTILRRRLAN